MFQLNVLIYPDKNGIHCGSCKYQRGDGFRGFCSQFQYDLEYDQNWSNVKRCTACLKAEKDCRD
jgi:hypothetical protein